MALDPDRPEILGGRCRPSSMAMLGSLADSGLDLVASLVVLLGVRIAAVPADHDHRFGHGKAEALAALVQVILITLSAVFIGFRAVQRLMAAPQTGRCRARHRRVARRDGADFRADQLSAARRPPHRLARDRYRPAALCVRPDAQWLGDRRARARPVRGTCAAPMRSSDCSSPCGCCGARGARRATRSTS